MKKISKKQLLAQYSKLKDKYPNVVLVFEFAEYYQCVGNDVDIACHLFSSDKFDKTNGNLCKLIRRGYKIAVCTLFQS